MTEQMSLFEDQDFRDADEFKVGAVWYASWGYDQTNVDYLQVVRESKASVWLRPIAATVLDGKVYPSKDNFLTDDKPELHRKQSYGKREGRTLYLTLDYVRTAWPYEGGGRYDTIAAGQAGH